MTGQTMDGPPVARLQATDFHCCCCCDAGDTQAASVTGTELSEEEAGPQGLRPTSGWVRWAGICLQLEGFQLLKQPHSAAQGLIGRIQKHMAEILSCSSRRKGEMLTRLLRWTGRRDSLFNTGWHFQGGG